MQIATQADHTNTIEIIHDIYKYDPVRSSHALQWKYITPQHPTDVMKIICVPSDTV